MECFPFAPVAELSAQRLQGAGLPGEARLLCPEPLPAASAARGDESSSLVRFARPSLQRPPAPLQPTALGEAPISGPTRLYWHPQTPSQLIFSFVFSRRRLERTEGIRLTSGCAYLTACYQRKEGNWLLECLCALSARGVPGTVPHPACSALTAVDGRALPGGRTRGGRLREGGRVPGHRETRRSAAC